MAWTVAVTGPTGDIGISAVERTRAASRSRARHRDGPPAVRPVRSRMDQNRVPAGRHPRPRGRRCPGRRRRHRRPPRVHHHGFAGGQRSGQPGRHPQRIRGHGGGRPSAAACLHLIGRRLRLPLRQSRPDHRRRTDQGLARALLLRAEGGLRSRPRRNHVGLRRSRCSSFVRASLPGPRRPRSPRRCRGTASRRGAKNVTQAVPAAQAAVPGSGHAGATCSPRRRRRRNRPGRNDFRASGAYNLAGDGVLSMSDVGDALGARPVPVPRVAGVGGVRSDRPAAVRPVGTGVAARGPHLHGDGHTQGEDRSWAGHRNTPPPRHLSALAESIYVTASGRRYRRGRSASRRPRRTSRRRHRHPWPGRSRRRRRRLRARVRLGGLGLLFVHRTDYPAAGLSLAVRSLRRRGGATGRPSPWAPGRRARDRLVLGMAVRARRVPDRRSTRWS